MKKIFILIILMTSCVKYENTNLSLDDNIDFNKEYSFLEFKKTLEKYNDKKGYPNIDE